MKATIDSNGVLVIEAENGIEAFALRIWARDSTVEVDDPKRMESEYLKGSSMLINLNVPEE